MTAKHTTDSLLAGDPLVVTAGLGLLQEGLAAQATVTQPVAWRPPVAGCQKPLAAVMADPRREMANRTALDRLISATPHLVDVRPAHDALGLEPGRFLHAGPPITWDRASGPLRGALIGAAMLEGLAGTPEEAERLMAASSGVTLEPCHHHRTVGPMAGVVSPSMWVFEVLDTTHGGRAYCTLNEGLGQVLRYGAYGPAVLDRLRWMSSVLAPLLRAALRSHGPLDVQAIVAQMLAMGDEGHNRNRAGTSLLLRRLLHHLLLAGAPSSDMAAVVDFLDGNDHFFLNVGMAASKACADAARDIPGSTLVVAMARNGTDFGIQVSGTGDRWFTGRAAVPDGLYLGSFGPGDASPDIGDSTITETVGLGGFAMAAAPAIVQFVGGRVADAISATLTMYEIALDEHPLYRLPILDFRGCPVGIDVTLVARTGILPRVNTGIAGKVPGTGQVGAGLVQPPMEAFTGALQALAEACPGRR
jgi:hypothetical protein